MRSGPPAQWRRARPPARRAVCGAAPVAAHPAAHTGRPGCGRSPRRPTLRFPRAHHVPPRSGIARPAPRCSPRKARCREARPAPASASGTRTSSPTTSARRRPRRRRRTGARAPTSGAPARHPWRWPAGWSAVIRKPTDRRSRRRAAARRRASRCAANAACGGRGRQSQAAKPAARSDRPCCAGGAASHRRQPVASGGLTAPHAGRRGPAPGRLARRPAGGRSGCRCPRWRRTSAAAARRWRCRTS